MAEAVTSVLSFEGEVTRTLCSFDSAGEERGKE